MRIVDRIVGMAEATGRLIAFSRTSRRKKAVVIGRLSSALDTLSLRGL